MVTRQPGRGRRSIAGAVAIMLALVTASSAIAANFGSNTAAYQSPADPCDTDASSQCIANNGIHVWYPDNVTANLLAATRTASATYEHVLRSSRVAPFVISGIIVGPLRNCRTFP